MFSTPTSATEAAPANTPAAKLDTNQQSRPLPYWFGRRWFAITWCVSHLYNYKETKKSSSGKGGKSGGSQSTVTCDLAGLVACGMADYIEAIEVNGAIAWSSGTLTRDSSHPEHTGDIVTGSGTFRLHWGTETASGAKDEWIVLGTSSDEDHPWYRGKIVLEAKGLNCGSGGSVPNVRVLLERAPRFGGLLDENRSAEGANPVTALAEILENDFFGCGLSGSVDTDTAALLANTLRARTQTVTLGAVTSHTAQMSYISGYVEDLRSMTDVLSSIMENFDGWVRRKGEKLEIGQFTHGDLDTSGLLELTLHDFADEPQFPNPSVDHPDVITDAIVTGPDREIAMQDSWEAGPNPAMRDRLKQTRQKTFARPFLCTSYQQKEMADLLVSMYSLAAPESTQKIRRAKLGSTQAGDRVIVNYSPDSSRMVYRVTKRSDPAKGGTVDLSLERERGLGPLAYIPPADPAPTLPDPAAPGRIVHARMVQVPAAWAGSPLPVVIPLAGRPDSNTRGFRPWFSIDDATYDQLGDTIDWAVYATTVGAIGISDATITITTASDDVLDDVIALLADQSAAAQADDTLLLFMGSEILSIGHVMASGDRHYTLSVLRARRGSVAASYSDGSDVYVLPRAECVMLDHAQFPRTATSRYFKLQNYTAALTQNLSDALRLVFTFANTTTNPATSFSATATTESASLTWTNPTDADLDHAAVYIKAHGAGAPSVGSTPDLTWPVTPGAGSKCLVPGLTAGTTYDFYVCLYDTASYPSSMVGPQSCTPLAAPTGSAGTSGLSNATILIYQRAGSTPALPSASCTYAFATATLSGLNNGWSTSVPAANGSPLYVSAATASTTGGTDTIAPVEWASPIIMAQDGATGASGLSSATVFLFQRTGSATAPSLPSATATYTFATGLATGLTNGWTQSMPASGGAYRWATTAAAFGSGTTDTITPGEWAAVSLLAQDGATGPTGPTGSTGATGGSGNNAVILYLRSTSAPAMPTGDNPASWSSSAPGGAGVLWMTTGLKTSSGALVGSWSAPVRMPGAATFFQDPSGIDTSILLVGDQCFDTTQGNRILRWSGNAWTAVPLDAAALSVGQLSAITGDLGTVNAGAINIGGADSTSAHVGIAGDIWVGANDWASAPLRITSDGLLYTQGTGGIAGIAGSVATPVFSPWDMELVDSGTGYPAARPVVSCATPGALISINWASNAEPTDPTPTNSQQGPYIETSGSDGIGIVPDAVPAGGYFKIKARAFKDGKASAMNSMLIRKRASAAPATPGISPASGDYSTLPTQFSLAVPSGLTAYYTTSGVEPTLSSASKGAGTWTIPIPSTDRAGGVATVMAKCWDGSSWSLLGIQEYDKSYGTGGGGVLP